MDEQSVRRTDEDVEAFIANSADPGALRTLDAAIRSAIPGISRTLWRGVFWGGTEQAIIGYGDITQPRPRGPAVEWFLIGLAQQQRHLSLNINAADEGRYLSQHYAERLGRVKVGAASIAFRSPDLLDLGVLDEMLHHAARVQPPDQPRG